MRVDLFDFDLPQERIALRPVSPRDAARMLWPETLFGAVLAMVFASASPLATPGGVVRSGLLAYAAGELTGATRAWGRSTT